MNLDTGIASVSKIGQNLYRHRIQELDLYMRQYVETLDILFCIGLPTTRFSFLKGWAYRDVLRRITRDVLRRITRDNL